MVCLAICTARIRYWGWKQLQAESIAALPRLLLVWIATPWGVLRGRQSMLIFVYIRGKSRGTRSQPSLWFDPERYATEGDRDAQGL